MADQPTGAPVVATPATTTLVTYDVSQNRRRLLQFMRNTHDTLLHVLATVSQETATSLRDAHDGDQGWTVLEVLCHLRDFDNIFRRRAQQMCAQDQPTLPFYDHEQLAAEGNYNHQRLTAVKAEFSHSRRQTIVFFEQLDGAQWQRAGIHPERGPFTMLDAALQVGMHDMTHIEQITRILFQNEL
jgi:uncharacterized damage-inducible protein DinB